MKFIILQEKLKKGINFIERISSRSLTLPILNNILISTEKNFLNLAATDLEIGIKWWGLTKIEKQGKVTIPARLLSSFIGLLPNKKIDLETKNNDLFLSCGNHQTQIKGISAEEFPIIPKIKEEETISINSKDLCKGINQIVDIAVSSITKPEISGLLFSLEGKQITLVATDSFRLGEKKIFLKKKPSSQKEISIIIPQKAAKEITNIFSEVDKELKIYFSPNQIMFELGMEETPHPEIQLISRLIEGEYPNYQEIIPKKNATQIILEKDNFLNQIKSASLFSGKVNEVKIKVDPQKKEIEIFSQDPEVGEYKSSVPGKIKGEACEVSFNHRFLMDGLASIRSAEVSFELNKDSGPGVLKPIGDENYVYVVMPIKGS